MNNGDLWATIVGALLPTLISVVTQARWSDRVKSIVALVICFIAGGITSYYSGAVDWQDVGRTIMLVTISTMTFYRNFWKPTGAGSNIQKLTDIGGAE